MKQATMVKPGTIVFNEVEKPVCLENQVLIKIHYIGICGSDIHVFHGRHPFTSYPVVQGHEVSGEVIETGKEVLNIKIGDKIVIRPQITCGRCRQCKDGKYNICENLKVLGFQTDGAGAEYYASEEQYVIKIPDDMAFEAGAIVEPLAVGIHALELAGGVEGLNVLVIGAGTIGNLTAQAAKAKNAKQVMVSDISDFRLKLALECGVTYIHNPKNNSLEVSLLRDFGQDKADVIFDCVGTEESLRACISNARKGTKIINVGVYKGEIKADISKVQDNELCLLGTLMYLEKDMLESVDLLYNNKIEYKKIVTKKIPFHDFAKAYHLIDENGDKEMKVLIAVAEKTGASINEK